MEKRCREDAQGAKVRRILLLSSPRRRGSSGICGAPVWIPARPCGPSGMTSEEGCAIRDDVSVGGVPSGMTSGEEARREA